MEERMEEFTQEGKNFFYVDFGRMRKNDEIKELCAKMQQRLAKYPEKSVYAIISIENIMFDTETRKILEQWDNDIDKYIKYSAVMEVDGIKKLMFSSIFDKRQQTMRPVYNKEQALSWLLQRE